MSLASPPVMQSCRRALQRPTKSSTKFYETFARYASTQTQAHHSTIRTRRRGTICQQRRWQSTDTASVSPSNPKIAGIVDQISQLTLLETADLVASLKSRLNIPDLPTFSASSMASSGPLAAAAPAEEDEPPAPAAQEKTLFTLKLESFEAASKPKIIKEVKAMLGLSLVDSKKFVESAPKVLKESVPKEEAEKIMATIKGLGGVVSMD